MNENIARHIVARLEDLLLQISWPENPKAREAFAALVRVLHERLPGQGIGDHFERTLSDYYTISRSPRGGLLLIDKEES